MEQGATTPKSVIALGLLLGLTSLFSCSDTESLARANESNRGRTVVVTASVSDAEVETPISLTADDGTGLVLESLHVQAVVEGPLAFTELRMRFRNPLSRELEGRFQVALPEGATVSRLAMKLAAEWQEAEVVERMAARRAYEDFLHRKQDPMLLEKEAGNQFSARIFPIAANGVKEVIVAYSHELSRERGYRLPLRGLPMVGDISVRALIAERDDDGLMRYRSHRMSVKNRVPTGDFYVPIQPLQALRNGTQIVARVEPTIGVAPSRLDGLTILFDTSASRAPGYARYVKRLAALVHGIADTQGTSLSLCVIAFDQVIEPIFDGVAGDFGQEQLDKLIARRPLGASDLGAALKWAGQQSGTGRILVISDVVVTAGDAGLATLAKALPATVSRIDALLVGGIRDSEAANRLVRGTREHDGVVLRATMSDAEIVRRLGAATTTLELSIAGAKWTWPRVAYGVQPGDEIIVYGEFADGTKAPEQVSVAIGDTQRVSLRSVQTTGLLLTRSMAQAQIARLQGLFLEESNPEEKRAHKAAIVELSVKHRVLSDHTALLVLESEADYQRFGIDRKALVDILVIDASELRMRASKRIFARAAPMPIPKSGPAEEAGGTGTKMAEAEGRMGARASSRAAGQFAMRKASAVPQRRALLRQDMIDSIERSGSYASAVGTADFASGLDDSDLYGGLLGNEVGAASGSDPGVGGWGYGRSSNGRRRITGIGGAKQEGPPALTGPMAEVHEALEKGRVMDALAIARRWRAEESGSVMALVALGEALEAAGKTELAARAYGSIIDLFPARADLRRFASARLTSLKGAGRLLAIDSLRRAVAQRPDHLSVHRLLAYALVRTGDLAGAFASLEAGLGRRYPQGRFEGGTRILREDLGIVARAWIAKDSSQRASITKRLRQSDSSLATKPSLRFVLNWETDANDVDFHIYDSKGGHAFFGEKSLPSGGELYADVTTGYGPECFTINGKALAYPYELQVHYYSRGPMGYGMGQVEILLHDGKGGLDFDTRPFVVMNDGSYLRLGSVDSESLEQSTDR